MMKPLAEREITITRTFDAPRALVFQAWTDAKVLAQWWGRLVFTNMALDADGNAMTAGLTTVTFAEEGGKTKLTLHTRGSALVEKAIPYLQGMEYGWGQSIDKLAALLTHGA
jgi:uncharacterized protein YndB with AHSA1/START domain